MTYETQMGDMRVTDLGEAGRSSLDGIDRRTALGIGFGAITAALALAAPTAERTAQAGHHELIEQAVDKLDMLQFDQIYRLTVTDVVAGMAVDPEKRAPDGGFVMEKQPAIIMQADLYSGDVYGEPLIGMSHNVGGVSVVWGAPRLIATEEAGPGCFSGENSLHDTDQSLRTLTLRDAMLTQNRVGPWPDAGRREQYTFVLPYTEGLLPEGETVLKVYPEISNIFVQDTEKVTYLSGGPIRDQYAVTDPRRTLSGRSLGMLRVTVADGSLADVQWQELSK